MFVFIKSYTKPDVSKKIIAHVQRAYKIEDIEVVSEVYEMESGGKGFQFNIRLKSGEKLFSTPFKTKEEAEMSQVSTITILNAIELYFDRFKHVPEQHATPVMFQVPDSKQKKLVPGKISMFDTPVYTIQI